jgi:hypothetical protein
MPNNTPIHRFSVTAYSLGEATTLLPDYVVITDWHLVKDVTQ